MGVRRAKGNFTMEGEGIAPILTLEREAIPAFTGRKTAEPLQKAARDARSQPLERPPCSV